MNTVRADRVNDLYTFAVCGKEEDFNNKILYLANNIAEKEIWDLEEPNGVRILRKYILITFSRCNEQNKIIYSEDGEYCATNTGLLSETDNKEVLMLFTRNVYKDEFNKTINWDQKDWYFAGFKITSDRDYMKIFKGAIPEMATYTDNFEDYYFNPNIPIEVDMEHIIEDNWPRVSKEIQLPKEVVRYMFNGVLDIALKKAKRNLRLVIPQYYQGKIGYLIPLEFPVDDKKRITMALTVEKLDGIYRANTIYNVKDAYAKARILMKPNTNWLIEEK